MRFACCIPVLMLKSQRHNFSQTNNLSLIIKFGVYCRSSSPSAVLPYYLQVHWYHTVAIQSPVQKFNTQWSDKLFGSLTETFEQEVFSKKIIVKANTALLSLKKDSGIVKGSKWPDDGAALTQEGAEWPKNWTETTKQWDQNDSSRMFRVRNCSSLFR